MSYEALREMSDEERAELAQQLSEEAAAGDTGRFNEVYALYYGQVFGHLRRSTGSHETAEELAQDTFVKAFGAIERGQFTRPGENALRSWIFRIATNTVKDSYRQASHRPLTRQTDFEAEDYYHPVTEDFSGAVDDAYASDDFVARMLGGIRQEFKDAVVGFHIRGESYEEIAEAQGVPVGTVKSRLFRGRAELLKAYKAQESDE